MAQMQLSDFVAEQTWLDPIGDTLQTAVQNAYAAGGQAGQKTMNALSGTWLGHPLHPVLTDVPVGTWTAAFLLDMFESITGSRNMAAAADASVGIGLVAALAAAATGLSDWHYTVDRPRRLGLAHGLLNVGAAGLYTASFIARMTGARGAGRTLANMGYGIAFISQWLGGELVFDEHLGENHATTEEPASFTAVLDESALREGQPQSVDVEGIPVMVLRKGGRIYALGEQCAHLGGPLSEGDIQGETVICPWHGSQFALADGKLINGPSAYNQPCFQTRVRDGKVEIGPRCTAQSVTIEAPDSVRQGMRAAGEAISGAIS